MEIVPIIQREAFAFIKLHHRHHKPPRGSVFQIAVAVNDKIVGVAIAGRPVARNNQDGFTLEVTRMCTDGTANVCSMLYAACWRAAKAMGYRKMITYILVSDTGISLKASGWHLIGERGGKSWNRKNRPRVDMHPLQTKILYEIL